jgi:hypothetical protein
MSADDEARVDEIRAWFDERGHDLYLHEVAGSGWRAAYIPKDSRISAAEFGVGDTPLAAAEDAEARFMSASRMVYGHDEGRGTEHGAVLRGDGAPEPAPQTISVPMLVHERALGEPEVVSDAIETLETYGWGVLFEEEPGGNVTGHLLDRDSGKILKSAVGFDFEDTWLELGIGTTPPSKELRRERDQRSSEDSTT